MDVGRGCSLLGDAAPSRRLSGVFWLSRLRVCSGQGLAPAAEAKCLEVPLEQCHALSPRPCPSRAQHSGAMAELGLPLLWGELGGSRVFPAFRFFQPSGFPPARPVSHNLVTVCCN